MCGKGTAAVFLDRDGTLIRDRGYIHTANEVDFLPGSIEGLALLSSFGFQLIVVTNQSGIGRGMYQVEDMQKVHEYIKRQLRLYNVMLTDFFYCPHYVGSSREEYNVQCDCRKPAPGLIIKAAKKHAVDLSRSYMIGDKESDVEAGKNAGVRNSFRIDEKHNLLFFANYICDQSQYKYDQE